MKSRILFPVGSIIATMLLLGAVVLAPNQVTPVQAQAPQTQVQIWDGTLTGDCYTCYKFAPDSLPIVPNQNAIVTATVLSNPGWHDSVQFGFGTNPCCDMDVWTDKNLRSQPNAGVGVPFVGAIQPATSNTKTGDVHPFVSCDGIDGCPTVHFTIFAMVDSTPTSIPTTISTSTTVPTSTSIPTPTPTQVKYQVDTTKTTKIKINSLEMNYSAWLDRREDVCGSPSPTPGPQETPTPAVLGNNSQPAVRAAQSSLASIVQNVVSVASKKQRPICNAAMVPVGHPVTLDCNLSVVINAHNLFVKNGPDLGKWIGADITETGTSDCLRFQVATKQSVVLQLAYPLGYGFAESPNPPMCTTRTCQSTLTTHTDVEGVHTALAQIIFLAPPGTSFLGSIPEGMDSNCQLGVPYDGSTLLCNTFASQEIPSILV